MGMLEGLARQHPLIHKTFDEASDVLGFDLGKLCREGPADELHKTENTQPALLSAGVAVWRLWCDQGGGDPGVMAGHSLGEYTALVAAGSLEFSDALRLVKERGRQMQSAVPAGEGAMAAIIGLDDVAVVAVCEEAAAEQVVSAANFNAPGQVVIAGHTEAVQRASQLAKDKGARRALLLPVSVPSHCDLMRPAAVGLQPALEDTEVKTPSIAIIHNVDVEVHEQPEQIKDALLRQLYEPVQWSKTVQQMAEARITRVIECGPGKVLTGLVRRIDRSLESFAIGELAPFSETLEHVRQ